MVNAAQAELGLPQSTTIVAPTDNTGTQMLALANRVLDELRRMNRWTALQFEYDLVVDVAITTTGSMVAQSHVITNIPSTAALAANLFQISGAGIPPAARIASVDSATQITMNMENVNTTDVTDVSIQFGKDTYPEPSGFDYFNNRTMWDRTNRWELLGPQSPQMDQWHRSGIVTTGPRRFFRQIGVGSNFRLWPPPFEISAPLQLVFEYLSLNAVSPDGGSTYTEYFTTDTDQTILDDQAVIMGIKWMFWEIKGFGSYVTLQNRWMDYCNRLAARDGGAPTLNWVRRTDPLYLSPNNVQDGYYPGPGSTT